MIKNQSKLLVIGIDQAIPYFIRKFLADGVLPNIEHLVKNGVFGEGYSCVPCDTPTNWTTIATGANTATHGVTSFYMHLPGEPLDLGMKYRSRTQLYKNCRAQYIWDVADNNGFKPFVLNYPSGWPSIFKNGVMSLFSWNIPESLPKMLISSEINKIVSRSQYPLISSDIVKKIFENIKNLAQNLGMSIEGQISDYLKNIKINLTKSNVNLEIYDSIRISEKYSGKVKIIKEGEWSQWLKLDINSEYGVLPSLFRIRLLKIEENGKFIELEHSGIYNTKGWSVPESFGEKIVKNVFNYNLPKKKEVEFMIYGKMKNFLKSARNESLSLVQALDFAKRDFNWDFCFFHYHPLDTVNHDLLAYLYKDSRVYTEEKANKALNNVKTAYQIVDEMVGELMKRCIDKDTITLFLSDHGAIPVWKVANITKILIQAELITYKFIKSQKKYIIDWNKTKAFPYMEPPFIWVNLQGRDPNGIVEQKDYESVRDYIIEVLLNARDQKTNVKIIDKALKREDATNFGLNGERIGDVVYFLKSPYGIFDGDLDAMDASSLSSNAYNKPIAYDSKKFFGAHAYYTPDTVLGDFSISVPLVICGKGIKKGEHLNRIINLTDIAPTLSHLLNIPKPKQAQGSIIYDIQE
jgi:predicted AlkP superfamily phosphohydrolase/phosphomutase